MKAHRSALLSAGIAVALVASAVPSVASAQRQQVRGPDTKNVLVTTFRGDVEGGIRAADEIRNRIQGEYSIRTLYAIPKKDIDANLVQSGYRPDSALNPTDVKELGKLLRADEIIDGIVTKQANGNYRVQARMFLPRDVALSQPLGTFEDKDFGRIAKQVVDEYDKARKQIPENDACTNGIRAGKPQEAIAAARKAIAQYGKGTLVRLCLASAYAIDSTNAASRDSVIAITKEVMALDPQSRIAWGLSYAAYKQKADTANALRALVGMMNADPTNSGLRDQVIAELVQSGKAEIAVPIAKQLVADNPGDPEYARTYWLVLRAAKNYKESVPAGIAWVSIDSSKADSSYYLRQIADLAADSSFAKAAEFAALASGKYPKSVDFLLLKAQNERKAGQLPAAKATLERALALDPKAPLAAAQLATIDADLGQIDDAVKVLKADVAADPGNKERDAALVLSFGKKLYDAAAASKAAADYRKALPILQASDEIQPSANASFLIAISAFQSVAANMESLKTSKSCDDFKQASEMLTLVSIHMPKGATVSKETAGQILGYVPQLQPFIDGSIKKLCK